MTFVSKTFQSNNNHAVENFLFKCKTIDDREIFWPQNESEFQQSKYIYHVKPWWQWIYFFSTEYHFFKLKKLLVLLTFLVIDDDNIIKCSIDEKCWNVDSILWFLISCDIISPYSHSTIFLPDVHTNNSIWKSIFSLCYLTYFIIWFFYTNKLSESKINVCTSASHLWFYRNFSLNF